MRGDKVGIMSIALAVAAGMGGEMHIPVPGLGFMAMYDLAAYAVAIPILLLKWNTMGKYMRRSLAWSFAWTAAAVLANMFNFIEMRYFFKCIALASSSWALMAAAYMLLKDKPKLYMWYLVGVGLGSWISVYYFRNGSLEGFAAGNGAMGSAGSSTENLIEKQIYPGIARGLFLGCVLPLFLVFKKMPVILVVPGAMYAGFYLLLHGGSRSNFGMFCAAAVFGFAVAYCKKGLRSLAKNPFQMVLLGSIGCAILFCTYKYMAKSGTLGEGEQVKLENEFGKEGTGVINGRAGFHNAIKGAGESLGLGVGGHLHCHSVIANALASEGIVGFLFWIYFYTQVLWFVCKRLPYSDKYSAFILLMVLTAAWDVFGSPFGTRHKFFVLMALIALCRDNPYYGVGTLFDPQVLGNRLRYGIPGRF